MNASTRFHLVHLYKHEGGSCCYLCQGPYENDLFVPNMERVSGLGPHGLMKIYHLCFHCFKANVRRRLKDKEPTRPI